MVFGSVCSGIEAASVAWLPLGWRCAFMSEIEPFPRAVLKHHYPDTPLHGDFTTIQAGDYEPIDVLVGGTPCQSFSVAGLRGGLGDERGNLALEYLRVADRLRPRWVVWENVPGVLSSGGGRDFGAFLGGLGECGYGWSYRVLDAQYFGLAQRRKRVFVVGHLGDWRPAAAVLAIPEGLRGHPAPRRETGEGIAASLTRGADSSGKGGYAGRRREDDVNLVANPLGAKRDGGWRGDIDNDTYVADLRNGTLDRDIPMSLQSGGIGEGRGNCINAIPHVVARCLNAHGGSGRSDGESETFVTTQPYTFDWQAGGSGDTSFRGKSRSYIVRKPGLAGAHQSNKTQAVVTHSLRAEGFDASEDGTGRGTPLVAAFNWQSGGDCRGFDLHPTAMALTKDQTPAITGHAVRRLTPRECERLQGFRDDYTLIPFHGKAAADGNRYRALGNSMAVPVMRWIGERIQQVATPEPASDRRTAPVPPGALPGGGSPIATPPPGLFP